MTRSSEALKCKYGYTFSLRAHVSFREITLHEITPMWVGMNKRIYPPDTSDTANKMDLPTKLIEAVTSIGNASQTPELERKKACRYQPPPAAALLTRKEKIESFSPKSWVIGGNKILPGIPSNWRIFESIWLSISSQIDSNILQLLGIPDRILFPPWLNFLGQMTPFFLSVSVLYPSLVLVTRLLEVLELSCLSTYF